MTGQSRLSRNYHDGWIESMEIGPRREVTFNVQLDPVWNPGLPISFRLRFAAIDNMEEVTAFFATAGDVHGIRIESVASDAKHHWTVQLDRLGSVTILARKVSEL